MFTSQLLREVLFLPELLKFIHSQIHIFSRFHTICLLFDIFFQCYPLKNLFSLLPSLTPSSLALSHPLHIPPQHISLRVCLYMPFPFLLYLPFKTHVHFFYIIQRIAAKVLISFLHLYFHFSLENL